MMGLLRGKLEGGRELRVSSLPIQDEQERLAHFRKLYDFYMGDREKILEYVSRAMRRTFKTETILSMQFPTYPLTKKIIDSIAVAYMEPAVRYITNDAKSDGIYQDLLKNSNIHIRAKGWNRLSKLLDTVYVQPVFRNERIEYDIFPPHSVQVVERIDDYLEAERVTYEKAFGDDTYEVTWTATEHEILDDGKRVEGLNETGGVNPYGLLPLIPLRLREIDDHWGEGNSELVGVNEKVNILLASSFYNALMQSHGILFGTNLDIAKQEKERGEKISIGPGSVVEANDVPRDAAQADLKVVNPNPKITENIQKLQWLIKTAAMMNGLSATNVSLEASQQSGISKVVDLFELKEKRRDDIEYLKPFEKRLFQVTRAVWNYHNPGKKISDTAEFAVDFIEPEVELDPRTEWEVKAMKKNLLLWNPVDELIDEGQGIDEAKALEYIRRSQKYNKEFYGGEVQLRSRPGQSEQGGPPDSAPIGGDSAGNDTNQN